MIGRTMSVDTERVLNFPYFSTSLFCKLQQCNLVKKCGRLLTLPSPCEYTYAITQGATSAFGDRLQRVAPFWSLFYTTESLISQLITCGFTESADGQHISKPYRNLYFLNLIPRSILPYDLDLASHPIATIFKFVVPHFWEPVGNAALTITLVSFWISWLITTNIPPNSCWSTLPLIE